MKRFGKARVPGCECTYNFTCRACLADAAPRGQLITRNWVRPEDQVRPETEETER
jgi:hypothetical protein